MDARVVETLVSETITIYRLEVPTETTERRATVSDSASRDIVTPHNECFQFDIARVMGDVP